MKVVFVLQTGDGLQNVSGICTTDQQNIEVSFLSHGAWKERMRDRELCYTLFHLLSFLRPELVISSQVSSQLQFIIIIIIILLLHLGCSKILHIFLGQILRKKGYIY